MKKIVAVLLVLVGTSALAIALNKPIDVWSAEVKASKRRGIAFNVPTYFGPVLGTNSVINSTANAVTAIRAGAFTIDFASSTITCVDSGSQTLTGAQVGDICLVTPPAGVVANAIFQCRVSAADTIIVRFCPVGTAADPLSGAFQVRAISNL